MLAGKGTQLGETDAISLADLCSEDIVIGEAVISPIIQNNMIGALEFSVPVSVTLQGSYQMSFKVVSATGQDIDLVAFSRFCPKDKTISPSPSVLISSRPLMAPISSSPHSLFVVGYLPRKHLLAAQIPCSGGNLCRLSKGILMRMAM